MLINVHLWKCPCTHLWHTCLLHNKYCWQQFVKHSPLHGNALDPQAESHSTKPAYKKRKLVSPDSFDVMLASEIEVDRKRKCSPGAEEIQLGKPPMQHIKANFLGPILKRRFIDKASTDANSEPPA